MKIGFVPLLMSYTIFPTGSRGRNMIARLSCCTRTQSLSPQHAITAPLGFSVQGNHSKSLGHQLIMYAENPQTPERIELASGRYFFSCPGPIGSSSLRIVDEAFAKGA